MRTLGGNFSREFVFSPSLGYDYEEGFCFGHMQSVERVTIVS